MLVPVEEVLAVAEVDKSHVGDVLLVGGTCHIPKVREELREFFGKEPFEGNFDCQETVAIGTALVAAKMSQSGEGDKDPYIDEVEYKDVCPYSIGTDIIGGEFSVLIERGTPLPVSSIPQIYVTTRNWQKRMFFPIYEGVRYDASKNFRIGTVDIEIPEAEVGMVAVELSMIINENGILSVTARVKEDGGKVSSQIIEFNRAYSLEAKKEFRNAEIEKENDIANVTKRREVKLLTALFENVISYIERYEYDVRRFLGGKVTNEIMNECKGNLKRVEEFVADGKTESEMKRHYREKFAPFIEGAKRTPRCIA